jgi:hypothetical protein
VKSENVFRFVALRPPVLPDDKQNVLRDDAVAAAVIDRIHQRVAGGSSIEEARDAVASEVLMSDEYFVVDKRWRRLNQEYGTIIDSMDKVFQDQDCHGFARNAEATLRRVFEANFNLKRFLGGDDLTHLRSILWISYLANILRPADRPGDREPMVNWMRFFQMLENCQQGDGDLLRTLRETAASRPMVPSELFAAGPVAERLPRQEQDESRGGDLERITATIDTLERARGYLEAQFRAKLERFLELRVEPRLVQLPGPPGNEGPREVNFGASEVDLLEHAPWWLRRDDFEGHQEQREVLEQIGVLPDRFNYAETIDRLDRQLTHLQSERAALQVTEDVVDLGTIFVRVRRRTLQRRSGGDEYEA